MDDLYCPTCRLVLFAAAVAPLAPQHCPRCATRAQRIELRPRRGAPPLAARSRPRAGTPRRSLVEFYNAALAGRRPPRVYPG